MVLKMIGNEEQKNDESINTESIVTDDVDI